jgi:hypothetical protein
VDAKTLARAHGTFNLVTGGWPILNMATFELALGPKEDTWLVKTVGGLLATGGLTQLATPSTKDGLAQTRRAGMAISGTLLAIDLWYGLQRQDQSPLPARRGDAGSMARGLVAYPPRRRQR